MIDHFFISYSRVDGSDFALKLADNLAAGPPPVPVWLDTRNIQPGEDWDEQIDEAIKTCKGMMFIMTPDSVLPVSGCKIEWVRGLKFKKPIIPLRLDSRAESPFRLESRDYIDFTGSFETALARLRNHLSWMISPPGQLQALKHRLADAERELPRTEPERQALIQADIEDLKQEISQQQAVIDNPRAAEQRVKQSIEVGLEGARKPAKSVDGISHGKFINPPPLVAPAWFQDRHVETGLIADFLKDESLRLMTVVGRNGIGKSAMVCRLLRSLQGGQLPNDGGTLAVDGIVYLSNARSSHRVNVPDLYVGLTKLLPDETVKRLDTVYKNPQRSTKATIAALAGAFPQGRTVVVLDNFEDTLVVDTGQIKDAELDEALHAVLELPPHGLKVIITTRILPSELALVEPARQQRLDLDHGLEHPFAENVLRAMDLDGKVGLRDAVDTLLAEARKRTRGYPRALEYLFGILSADRDTSLEDILNDTRQFLPEKVIEVLVGEAFSRLDVTAQRVMQALATYQYPVVPAAVDYLLQPYVPGVDSGRVLSRLVNMQFVRGDAGRYYVHQVDREYALSRITEGEPADRRAEAPPLTLFALRHRAAEWFKLSRKLRETWKSLDDLTAQLSELELRCDGGDYDTAAAVLLGFDFEYLFLWGHYRLMTELHERLQPKITDPVLAQHSVRNLGSAYLRMGRHDRAMVCYEAALRLARENNDRGGESAALSNLGSCSRELGQNARAIEYYEQALVIDREEGERKGESFELCGLGARYSEIGQLARAVDYLRQALTIAGDVNDKESIAHFSYELGDVYKDIGQSDQALECFESSLAIARDIPYRLCEAAAQTGIGNLHISVAGWEEAAKAFEQAIDIADEIGNVQFQNYTRQSAALVNLYKGDLAGARLMVEAAARHHFLLEDVKTSTVLGVIAYRQGDINGAKGAFAAAIDQADALLLVTPNRYGALDAKALALCGLALCGNPEQIPAARAGFKAARAITSDTGIVQRMLQLFDALAQVDTGNILPDIRPVAAGARAQ